MNENEKYFEYKIPIRRNELTVGSNYIVGTKETYPVLPDGTNANNSKEERVTWYQFKIPIKKYNRRVGSINDFKTIRFMRLYMTNFKPPTILRFATFELVRGDWRSYEQDLSDPKVPVKSNATLEVTSVNIEENSSREPVNYVTPPGVSRELMTGQPQLARQNEQALSMKVTELSPFDARAVYKNTSYDLRQYKQMQMFIHGEKISDLDPYAPANGDLTVFIRLGSDYKNNYYEYEVPLTLTPYTGNGSGDGIRFTADQVWNPTTNTMNIVFEALTNLKLERNAAKRRGIRKAVCMQCANG